MTRFASSRLAGVAATSVLLSLPSAARACTVCTGQGDNTTQVDEAMNGAIFFMLGILVLIFGLIAAVTISLARRAQAPIPAHLQLAEIIGSPSTAK